MRRIIAMAFLLGAGFLGGFCVNPRAVVHSRFSAADPAPAEVVIAMS